MTADLTILPVGGNARLAALLADVLKEIRRQGIIYQLTGTTTCLQGSWDQIMTVAKACHAIGRRHAAHVVTLIRVEDDAEGGNELQASIDAVKAEAGEELNDRPPVEADEDQADDGEETEEAVRPGAGTGVLMPA